MVAVIDNKFEPWICTRRWSIGVDLGQAVDATAICAVESLRYEFDSSSIAAFGPARERILEQAGGMPKDALHIRALERLPPGLSYVAQAEAIAARLANPMFEGAQVFVDATGVGRPVCDLLRAGGVKHTAVLITGGSDEHESDGMLHVPKLILVSQLQAALHSGELKIAKGLPEATAFVRELQEFRATWTEAGHIRFGARQGAHDDLVLAAALAVHGAIRHRRRRVTIQPLKF